MKTEHITIRIPEGLKADLNITSQLIGKTISALCRDSIAYFLSQFTEGKVDCNGNGIKKDTDVLQTLGFAEFIFWIYEKQFTPTPDEIEPFYEQLIVLIDSFEKNSLFNEKILIEFRKIRVELNDYLDGEWTRRKFIFPTDKVNGLNYRELANWMYTLRYDDKNKRIIEVE